MRLYVFIWQMKYSLDTLTNVYLTPVKRVFYNIYLSPCKYLTAYSCPFYKAISFPYVFFAAFFQEKRGQFIFSLKNWFQLGYALLSRWSIPLLYSLRKLHIIQRSMSESCLLLLSHAKQVLTTMKSFACQQKPATLAEPSSLRPSIYNKQNTTPKNR